MYEPKKIESKWQKVWQEKNAFVTSLDSTKPKLYVLDMFPYPSGDGLHIGHSRIYVASDIVARTKRMQGFNVLHPTGWDAFGLPAENYAIKTGDHPNVTTAKNISSAKRQMQIQGLSYDWSRELNTSDSEYYRWTQWIFLQLFKKGLAYEADIPINWCPKDKTGLANEEVVNGRCDRCGTVVERKQMRQWVLKITDYAERLLQDLDGLDWPEKIKTMQRNWIGKSDGARIRFLVAHKPDEYIEVFTTRPDTLFGATYLVLAPEHPLVKQLTDPEQKSAVDDYIQIASKRSDLERTDLQKNKTGIFTGAYAINPVNGAKIPIWIADYVLASYGTGAIMAVPAHDERDFAFAKKFDLPIITVVKQDDPNSETDIYVGEGHLMHSGAYDGLESVEARQKIVADLQKRGLAEKSIQYRLRDWIFSRQRYWGEPIPIIHCPVDGIVPVPEDQLPVVLPPVDKYEPTGTGESPLANVKDWVNTKCPTCGGAAKRETNTMPQWAGSSWYYIRFVDPHNGTVLADKALLEKWLPVDIYIGGAEHAVLHLLYARFWHKFLFDLGVVPYQEPFTQLKSVGILATNAYKDTEGRWVHTSDVVVDGDMAFHKSSGAVLVGEVEKMSKSKGNVISPDLIIDQYGADTLRVYSMFLGQWDEFSLFDLSGIEGSWRFLRRVESLFDKPQADTDDADYDKLEARSIAKITADIDRFSFNTAVSQLMIMSNALHAMASINKKYLETFLRLLSPFAPHLGEELWSRFGHLSLLVEEDWPKAEVVIENSVEIAVQVNGKLRATLTVPMDMAKDDIEKKARSLDQVAHHLHAGVLKVIVVPNKVVNFVVKAQQTQSG